MATVLETQRRKALRGVITDIEHNCSLSFISARLEGQEAMIASEIPKEEALRLNLQIGDTVCVYPIAPDAYFIVAEPRHYRSN